MSLARAELQRHDWDAIPCGCGQPAGRLLGALESVIAGKASGVIWALDDHVFVQSVLMPPAPAVCAVVMACMADGIAPGQEQELLRLLLGLVAGEEDGDSVESSLQLRCFETVRDGLWLVYRAFLNAQGPEAKGYADDVLEIAEWDAGRLRSYRNL
ncbi:hypothetical protein ABT255_14265 [Streptomyces mirabilis]|uniref:hypothetical protein n=1 Tax=Streptomyces mirabilis TaxID=68239 RepID=UPI00331C4A04